MPAAPARKRRGTPGLLALACAACLAWLPAPGAAQELASSRRTPGPSDFNEAAMAEEAKALGPGVRRDDGESVQADAEIRALIAGLGDSGCRFRRNGRWHDADDARAHLQRKYDWARRRNLQGDAEAFIEQAASRSSLTGRAYRVACPGRAEVDAGDWFRARLAAIRASAASR